MGLFNAVYAAPILYTLGATLVLYLYPTLVAARVSAIDVEAREKVLGGRHFGRVGPYTMLAGRVDFEFDPANPANRRIVDLDKAPVNEKGLVEASANFLILRPKTCRGPCVGFLEVSNRGGKAALAYFNNAGFSNVPRTPRDFGDGFLMRHELTMIWLGWQFDVPPGDGRLRLTVPVAVEKNGQPIRGLARSDWTVDAPTNTLALAHRNHIAYPVADPQAPQNILTIRNARLAERHIVHRQYWRFGNIKSGTISADPRHIYAPNNFKPGIYELVYAVQDPSIVGIGLVAIRDMMSYAKYEKGSLFPVDHGIAFGVSQTGRFLRHFIYQNFNTDEQGRKVFDGMMIHAAGAGRGSFNHRFAQPSRDAHRYSAFFYPTDLFPFSGRMQQDPETGQTDGLFHGNPDHWPKVFYTNTGYEYWGRAAALIHSSVDGLADVEPLPNERVYHLASAQHFVGQFPPTERLSGNELAAYRGNPLDFHPTLRALLIGLVDWVVAKKRPPDSRYPRVAEKTLVPIDAVRFPALPGIEYPTLAHQAYRVDYGPRWPQGIIDRAPPRIGKAFPSLVPQLDANGNEMGGIRGVALRVPLASYFPWSLRTGYTVAPRELVDFYGTWVPFAFLERSRLAKGEPRPSATGAYKSREAYLAAVRRAASDLCRQGFLLCKENADRVIDRAASTWDWLAIAEDN